MKNIIYLITSMLMIFNVTCIIQASSLHEAVKNGDLKKMHYSLKTGISVNDKNDSNETPLHIAILNNRYEIAELLIKYGALINAKNDLGQTPLHLAVQLSNVAMVKLLINKGANVNDGDLKGETPLDIAQFEISDWQRKELNSSQLEDLKKRKSEILKILKSATN